MVFNSPTMAEPSRPPRDILPGLASLAYVLYSDDNMLAQAGTFRVWPNGVEFTIAMRLSPEFLISIPEPSWLNGTAKPAVDGHHEFDGIEVGMVTGNDQPVWCSPEAGCRGTSSLTPNFVGGQGNPSGGDYRWWLSPIPLTTPFSLSIRWTAQDIESDWIRVDTDALFLATENITRAKWQE